MLWLRNCAPSASRACGVRATTMTPLVPSSSRCTMPGRRFSLVAWPSHRVASIDQSIEETHGQQAVDQGAAFVASRRVDHQARGLVEDDQVFVDVKDSEDHARLGPRVRQRRSGRRHEHRLPLADPRRGCPHDAPDGDVPLRDPPL